MSVREEKRLLHQFSDSSTTSLFTKQLFVILLVFILLGIVTGYLLARKNASTRSAVRGANNSSIITGARYGSDDMKTFKDTTEGLMQAGGIGDEGQYHLTRPGGESQNVYLTSSIVDLSKFIRHKVKVWGQTQKAAKAGWLMDVGRVEVIE